MCVLRGPCSDKGFSPVDSYYDTLAHTHFITYIYFETVAVAFDGSLVTGGMVAATTREVHRSNDQKKKKPVGVLSSHELLPVSNRVLNARARSRVCVCVCVINTRLLGRCFFFLLLLLFRGYHSLPPPSPPPDGGDGACLRCICSPRAAFPGVRSGARAREPPAASERQWGWQEPPPRSVPPYICITLLLCIYIYMRMCI